MIKVNLVLARKKLVTENKIAKHQVATEWYKDDEKKPFLVQYKKDNSTYLTQTIRIPRKNNFHNWVKC